ncbi:hypothetical protein GCM10029964_015120 [Kibdelosporangium lantanae]
MQHLVCPVTGHLPGLERQVVGVTDVELGRPAFPRHRDHRRIWIDPHGTSPTPGQLTNRPTTPTPDVNHRATRDITEQLVGTRTHGHGHGMRVTGVKTTKQTGHARHAPT